MSEQRFDTPRPVRLVVKLAAGDITVSTIDGQQSTVALEGPSKLVGAAAVDLIGDRLVVAQQRNSLMSMFERWDGPLRASIRVPHGTAVEIVTASGDVSLDGALAGLTMKSASGDVRMTGEIDGDAEVKTVSGAAHLPRVAGDVTVRTVSGEVEVESAGGSVTVKSVSGDVRVGSVREGDVTVRSVSGDVEVGVASGTSFDLDAGSASGALNSEMPLSDSPSGAAGRTVVIRTSTVSGDFRVFRAA
jgi:putative adhesin